MGAQHSLTRLYFKGSWYDTFDNGPGCGDMLLDKDECAHAAVLLGYSGAVREGSWSSAPYGCHVGESDNSWQNTYFNFQHGQTGRDIYKSICRASTYFNSFMFIKYIL